VHFVDEFRTELAMPRRITLMHHSSRVCGSCGVNENTYLGRLSGQVVDAMAVTWRRGKPPVAARLRRAVRRLNREALYQLREFVAVETVARATGARTSNALIPGGQATAFHGSSNTIDQRELFRLADEGWDELRLPQPQELSPAKALHPLRPAPHHRRRQPHC
jgi:hypothetical protein